MRVHVNARNGTGDFECGPGEKILHAGLRHGLELPYECATGTCGTCKGRLVSGRTESAWADAPGAKSLKADEILTCQSVAREDCALEVAVLRPREPDWPAPRPLGGRLRDRRALTHDVVAFEVDLEAPLDFEAGQFALVSVPGLAGARAYSMVNHARGARALSFVVKKKPGGGVSEWLFGAPVDGSPLGLVAPFGRATFRPGVGKHVVCIAGGSGIAGMMSILDLAVGAGHFADWDGHVFFGVRTARDVFYLEALAALRARAGERLTVTVALSDEDVSPTLAAAHPRLAFARGFVHAVAGERLQGRWAGVRAWVAGPPPMVDACLRLLLREARLSPADIRYDKFS